MLFNEEELKQKFTKVVESFGNHLKTLRTGRPNIEAINSIQVIYYGAPMQLNYIAQVSIADGDAVIKLNDKGAAKEVEAALLEANLGSVNQTEPGLFRLKFPPMTEEVRLSTVKEMRKMLEEDYKRSARTHRQEAREKLKALEKVSEDEVKRDEEKIQKMLDECTEELDAMADKKEAEIMTV